MQKLSYTDKLALDRTLLANERTFLAYFRTAIVFLSSAVAILQLDVLQDLRSLAFFLLGLSPILLVVGGWRYYRLRKKN
ncbi:MAG: DUF202 domain-containing protein [Bacteroidetes bacterium]|nr:MAG: DUF202 domain-containing protein [Bacteroidota bacterium]